MKLIRCTVRGFGNICEQSFAFDDGLNVFCHQNGWGKSTLAAFLKAMLYGLSASRATVLSENERKRFLPWDTRSCGGSLIYEVDGRRYRVERSFSAKSTGSDDTCLVYDEETGAVCTPDRPLGEVLFGVDADAFERTVFLSERALSGRCANPTVKAKLADLVGTDADLGDFDNTLRALDDRRRALYINRKGSTALINRIDERIRELSTQTAELEREIAYASSRQTAVETTHERIEQLRAQYEALRRESDGLRRPEDGRMFSEQYTAALRAEQAAQERYNATRAAFGELLPSEQDILQVRAALARTQASPSIDTPDPTAELRLFFKRPTSEEELQSIGRDLYTPKPTILPQLLCVLIALASVLLGILVHPLALCGIALALLPLLLALRQAKRYRQAQARAHEFIVAYTTDAASDADAFGDICAKFATYTRLLSNEGSRMEQQRQANEAHAADITCLQTFAHEYGLTPTDTTFLDRLLAARTRLPELQTQLTQAKEHTTLTRSHWDSFQQALDPTRRAVLDEQLLHTQRQLEECRMEEQRAKSERDALQEKTIRREQLTAALTELYEQKEQYRLEYNTILKTAEYLRISADRLTARYTKPTQDGFARYLKLLGGVDADYHLSVEFELRRDEGGELKPMEAYSRGTRDLHALALRLSLVDALFAKEQPPLIFDDPFVALDDERLSAAMDMLQRASRERQVLYFTCASARTPKGRP